MKRMNNKGFGMVGVLLLLLVLIAASGLGYYVYNSQNKKTSNASNSATDSKKSTVSEQDKLTEIKDKINQLNHKSSGIIGETMDVKVRDPNLLVQFPATFGYSFYASQNANNNTGSYKDQALDREKVDTILKDAGLSLVSKDGYEPVVTIFYESDLVSCDVYDSTGVASVDCSGKTTTNKVASDVKEAYDVAKGTFPSLISEDNAKAQLTMSSDNSVEGLWISASLSDDKYNVYLVKTSNSWQYVGTDTYANHALQPIACELVNKSQYKEVFKIYHRTCFN
jgi:hypothetical protein